MVTRIALTLLLVSVGFSSVSNFLVTASNSVFVIDNGISGEKLDIGLAQSPSPVPGDDIQLPERGPYQNEPTIAVNPYNPLNIAAGSHNLTQDGRFWTVTYRSTDGGDTWQSNSVPGLPFNSTHNFPEHGDPVVSFDGYGNAFYAGIAFRRNTNNDSLSVWVAKSIDGGLTYSPPVMVDRGNGSYGTPGTAFFESNDKPWIATDKRVTGIGAGNIYVTWTSFVDNDGDGMVDTQHILLSRSTDGGASFSAPTLVSDAGNTANQFSQVAVGPNGEAYVSWVNWNATPQRILFDKSTDYGATFGTDVVVDSFNVIPNLPNVFRTPNTISMDVDRSGGAYDGYVYIAYPEDPAGADASDISFTRSTDGGTTWSAPIRLNDDATQNDQFWPALVVDPAGNIKVAWYDRRDGVNNNATMVYLTESTDGGASRIKNIRISDVSFDPNGTFIGDYIDIDASVDRVYPIWTHRNATDGDQDVYIDAVKQPDFGDAPDDLTNPNDFPTKNASNGARALTLKYEWLGSRPSTGISTTTSEPDARPVDRPDDGVIFLGSGPPGGPYKLPYIGGQKGAVNVTVSVWNHTLPRYQGTFKLHIAIWIDWNLDDDWTHPTVDTGELVVLDTLDPSAWTTDTNSTVYEFDVPAGIQYDGLRWSRARLAYANTTTYLAGPNGDEGLLPAAQSPDNGGEIEDYAIPKVNAIAVWGNMHQGLQQLFYSIWDDDARVWWTIEKGHDTAAPIPGTTWSITPAIAFSPYGNATAVWRSLLDDNLYYSQFNYSGWSAPAPLATLNGSDSSPAIAYNSMGQAVVVWVHWNPGAWPPVPYSIYYRVWNGTSWLDVGQLSTPTWISSDVKAPKIAADIQGQFIVTWTDNSTNPTSSIPSVEYSVGVFNATGGFNWSAPASIPGSLGAAAIKGVSPDAFGNASVVWSDGWNIFSSFWNGSTFGPAQTVVGGGFRNPSIAFSPPGNATAVYERLDAFNQSIYIVHSLWLKPTPSLAGGWQAPVAPAADSPFLDQIPRIAYLSKESAVMIWHAQRLVPPFSEIYFSRWNGTNWSSPAPLVPSLLPGFDDMGRIHAIASTLGSPQSIFIHDVAIVGVTPSKTVVGQGYSTNVNVTVENQGTYTETFNIIAYANTTVIDTLTSVTLTSGNSTSITFTWDTTGIAKGVYTISANATILPDETDTADNSYTDGTVRVNMVGDVKEPFGIVDIFDLVYVAGSFGAKEGESEYKPNANLNCDGIVDIFDLVLVAAHYGEKDP